MTCNHDCLNCIYEDCINDDAPWQSEQIPDETRFDSNTCPHKRWQRTHKDRVSEYHAKYRQKNKEKCNEYYRNYYAAHKEEIIFKQRQRRKKERESHG